MHAPLSKRLQNNKDIGNWCRNSYGHELLQPVSKAHQVPRANKQKYPQCELLMALRYRELAFNLSDCPRHAGSCRRGRQDSIACRRSARTPVHDHGNSSSSSRATRPAAVHDSNHVDSNRPQSTPEKFSHQ
jgi:hypothetical protein